MAKRTYETPVADMLFFDYKNNVTASGYDASHCNFDRNPGGCAPKSYGKCKDYWNDNPGTCQTDNN